VSIKEFVNQVQKIMRKDPGLDGDAQRISQLVWLIFLFTYDARESVWEDEFKDVGDVYKSIIPEELRWRNWAKDVKDGKALTGDGLIYFVNNELLPRLASLEVTELTPKRQAIVKSALDGVFNYMKDGVLLREVVNILNEVNIHNYEESHAFNDIYENILKDLQSAGNSGEFYTPRPLTNFIVDKLAPKIGERIGDLACGTGGFLVDSFNYMYKPGITPEEHEMIGRNLVGVEKKPLPHILCMTNLILHGIDEPQIFRGNSLERNVREYNLEDKFDVMIMNPPFGGVEKDDIKANFPADMRTSETSDLFVASILYRLTRNGRVGIVLPDGFLFGADSAKIAIKKKLLETCNLHTIVRLSSGVFAPYTSLSTNVLFFEKGRSTQRIDFYQVQLPSGRKRGSNRNIAFSSEHLKGVNEWWDNRNNGDPNAYSVSIDDVMRRNYSLDFRNTEAESLGETITLAELMANLERNGQRIQTLNLELKRALEGVLG